MSTPRDRAKPRSRPQRFRSFARGKGFMPTNQAAAPISTAQRAMTAKTFQGQVMAYSPVAA